jgi:hypothetical protein
MIHRGEIFEKAIRESGFPISKLAIRIRYHRKSIYDFFTYADLDLDVMVKVGKVINYDFSKDIPELRTFKNNESGCNCEESIKYKRLYYELLEEQNRLLKKYQK